jgi:hypothetical protein
MSFTPSKNTQSTTNDLVSSMTESLSGLNSSHITTQNKLNTSSQSNQTTEAIKIELEKTAPLSKSSKTVKTKDSCLIEPASSEEVLFKATVSSYKDSDAPSMDMDENDLLNDSLTKEDIQNMTGNEVIEMLSSSEEDEESFSESFTDAWNH